MTPTGSSKPIHLVKLDSGKSTGPRLLHLNLPARWSLAHHQQRAYYAPVQAYLALPAQESGLKFEGARTVLLPSLDQVMDTLTSLAADTLRHLLMNGQLDNHIPVPKRESDCWRCLNHPWSYHNGLYGHSPATRDNPHHAGLQLSERLGKKTNACIITESKRHPSEPNPVGIPRRSSESTPFKDHL